MKIELVFSGNQRRATMIFILSPRFSSLEEVVEGGEDDAASEAFFDAPDLRSGSSEDNSALEIYLLAVRLQDLYFFMWMCCFKVKRWMVQVWYSQCLLRLMMAALMIMSV